MLNQLINDIAAEAKHKAIKTEFYLLAVVLGFIAILFFSMAGWHFIAQSKGDVVASLVLACIYFGLALTCMLTVIIKTHHQHARKLKANYDADQVTGIALVNAFLSGLNASRELKK